MNTLNEEVTELKLKEPKYQKPRELEFRLKVTVSTVKRERDFTSSLKTMLEAFSKYWRASGFRDYKLVSINNGVESVIAESSKAAEERDEVRL